jgi:hypothetical protein
VGSKPTIPVFKGAKTFHSLDCAATVISTLWLGTLIKNILILGKNVVNSERRELWKYKYLVILGEWSTGNGTVIIQNIGELNTDPV